MSGVRGWNGPVYVAEVTAPEGYRVTVGWDQSFVLLVMRAGERAPALSRGDDDDPNGPLLDVDALVSACSAFRVSPFAEFGAVDWRKEAGLIDALRRVSELASV